MTSVAQEQRTLTPDDLFRLEDVGDTFGGGFALSPDGKTLAYVRQRALPTVRTYVGQFSNSSATTARDVWLAPVGEGMPTNITKGETDGSGYWAPIWSPDGTHVAMLSTKGGGNVRLWVWEKSTGRLTKLSERGVASWRFLWVDSQRIAVVLLPEGPQAETTALQKPSLGDTVREWPEAWVGNKVTASGLDSGVNVDLTNRPQEQLVIIDLTGRKLILDLSVSIRDLRLAPDGRHLAFSREVVLLPANPSDPLRAGNASRHGFAANRYGADDRFQVVIADTGERIGAPVKDRRSFVLLNSLQWAPDSRNFAFIGVEREGPAGFRVYRGTVGGAVEPVTQREIDPQTLVWVDGSRLLVSGEHEFPTDGRTEKRIDWWLFSGSGAPRNLTQNLAAPPPDLLPSSQGRTCVGVVNGDIWRVDVASSAWTNLTASFDNNVEGIAWPKDGESRASGFEHIIVSTSRGALTEYYRVDMVSGAVTTFVKPSDSAQLVSYDPEAEVSWFAAKERTGTYLTIVQRGQRRSALETNTFLGEIAEGAMRRIDYRGLDGQNLIGWVMLPANYEAGKRYPVVAEVYAGSVYGQKRPSESINSNHFLNLQLLAARGYAVLFPSMPLKPYGAIEDPYIEMTKGVIPAIDKMIELGVADPKRLAVMGHSYGGYSVYGLVTQTNRFQAAIAGSGISDLVSLYGTFDATLRYETRPHEWHGMQSLAETGQIRMGNPPWKDWSRYIRNSPISYVDRVQTPLLIYQGDMDYIAIQQSEEFFTALYRQGKRARFIRYWGEGHSLTSPANIRDFWMEVYAWLDEFCDVSRDTSGNLVFDGDHVKSRNGAPPLKPEDFARFNEIELKSHPWVKQ